MNGELSTPTLPPGLPAEWVNQREEPCPQCGYNLHMLRDPRCPECGVVFRWQELYLIHCPRCDAALYAHDGEACPECGLDLRWEELLRSQASGARQTYEYASKPLGALVKTYAALLRPGRFWRRTPLESRPVVGRLVWVLALNFVAIAAGVAVLEAWSGMTLKRWSELGDAIVLPALLLVPVAVTAVSLPAFTPTLARFRVRRDQLLRCLAYGTMGLAWMGLLLVLVAVGGLIWNMHAARAGPVPSWTRWDRYALYAGDVLLFTALGGPSGWFARSVLHTVVAVGVYLFWLWWLRCTWCALRTYLRLNVGNAVALLISTQVIAVLLMTMLLLALCRQATYTFGRIWWAIDPG
jgi:ribosomal protein L37E